MEAHEPEMRVIGLIGGMSWESTAEYYRMINEEHERIVSAIEKRDDAAARTHMRAHLIAAIERLRKLADTLPDGHGHDAYEASPDLMQHIARGVTND